MIIKSSRTNTAHIIFNAIPNAKKAHQWSEIQENHWGKSVRGSNTIHTGGQWHKTYSQSYNGSESFTPLTDQSFIMEKNDPFSDDNASTVWGLQAIQHVQIWNKEETYTKPNCLEDAQEHSYVQKVQWKKMLKCCHVWQNFAWLCL